jgi:hypothetical protein
MVAVVFAATARVLMVNVALVAPAGIVTEAGTVAEPLLLVKATLNPPVGAAEAIVAVPVDEVPPTTVVGETVIELRLG